MVLNNILSIRLNYVIVSVDKDMEEIIYPSTEKNIKNRNQLYGNKEVIKFPLLSTGYFSTILYCFDNNNSSNYYFLIINKLFINLLCNSKFSIQSQC